MYSAKRDMLWRFQNIGRRVTDFFIKAILCQDVEISKEKRITLERIKGFLTTYLDAGF